MSKPTIEQMLYKLPPAIDDNDERFFLHLQPWGDRSGWNAFYGTVSHHGWSIHPFLRSEGPNPIDALVNLQSAVEVRSFSFEPDASGLVE